MSKLESEILEATQIRKREGGNRQTFLKRVIDAVHDLDQDRWESLSDDAQNWFNDAATADNKRDPIPDFPDVIIEHEPDLIAAATKGEEDTSSLAEPEEEPEEEEDEDEEEEEDADEEEEAIEEPAVEQEKPMREQAVGNSAKKVVAAKKVVPISGAKKTVAKKAAAPVKAVSGEKKPKSLMQFVTEIVVKKPSISLDQLMDKLRSTEGYANATEITVGTIRNDVRRTVKTMVNLGLYDVEV